MHERTAPNHIHVLLCTCTTYHSQRSIGNRVTRKPGVIGHYMHLGPLAPVHYLNTFPKVTSYWLTTIVMTSDLALELSIEQLIGALNKKLFVGCARVPSATPQMSRTLVATLTIEVRLQELEGSLEY